VLEAFVLAACINNNDLSCERAATAYYYQTGLDSIAKFMQEEYRDYILVLNVAAVVKNQELIIPMSKDTSIKVEPIKNKFEIRYNF